MEKGDGEVILSSGFYAGSPIKYAETRWLENCSRNYPEEFTPEELKAVRAHLRDRAAGKATKVKVALYKITRAREQYKAFRRR